MSNHSFPSHGLLWRLPAVVSAQIVLMLASSGPQVAWRGNGYTLVMAACAIASGCAGLWALWRLREWPLTLRAFIALVKLPLLAGALPMAGA